MNLENDYSRLPATLYTPSNPTPVAAPRLIKFNQVLAADLRLDLAPSDPDHLARIFSGNEKLPGSQPIALAYAGHQFGSFVPRLGDGRAVLLGEARDHRGVLKDIQLKGAGRTIYSRGGDGRAALGPVLREYLVSEAMTAMGIPSTRSLAAVLTGERGEARAILVARGNCDARGEQSRPRWNIRIPRGSRRYRHAAESCRLRDRSLLP